MKTLQKLFWNKPVMASLFFLLILISGCSKEEISPIPEDETIELAGLKSAFEPGETISLEGFSRFEVYSVGEHRYLFTGDEVFLNCLATLTLTGKNKFALHFEEYMGEPGPETLYRQTDVTGHISKSGQLKFFWEEVIPEMIEHTGIDFHGPGVNKNSLFYRGKYDGNNLFASCRLTGLQTQPATFPLYWKVPADPSILYEGPLQLKIWLELSVVDEL